MALTLDYVGLVIESDSSITDLPAFHAALRDAEDSAMGMVHPVTHTWKALDLGGGAFFYQADLANGWRLKFPAAGSYEIRGNLNGEIVPVAGVYVERRTSAAYATTAIGAAGVTPAEVWAYASRTLTAGAVSADLEARIARIEKLLRNKQITDPATGKMLVYDDDGVTVLMQGNLFEDAAGTTPYAGSGAERRERLA